MLDKISVIIPVYNVKSYLNKCIESVANQTYQNLEIICVDDGSTDGSSDLIDIWASKDSRIKPIHKENGGVSSARNAGLKIATGDYITFVDGDDYLETSAYQSIMECNDNNADIIIFGFKTDFYSKKIKFLKSKTTKCIQCFVSKKDIFDKDLYKHMHNSICNKLFKRFVVQECAFDENMKLAEDLYFCLDAYKYANTFQFVDANPYHYIFVDTAKKYMDNSAEKSIQRNIDLSNRMIQLGKDKQEAESQLKTDIIMTAYASLSEIINYTDYSVAKEIMKEWLNNTALKQSILFRNKKFDNAQIKAVIICCKFHSCLFTYISFKLIEILRKLG